MKERIISGFFMAIITIPLTLLGGTYFTILCVLLGILSLKEIMDLKEHHQKIPFIMMIICIINFLLIVLSNSNNFINGLSFSFLLLSLYLPCLFYKNNKYTTHDAIYLSGTILFIGMVFRFLIQIRNINFWLLIYLVFVPMINDIFAMLIGSYIGKHKCAPLISPNKTWEGTVGGIIFSVLICTIIYLIKIGNKGLVEVLLLTFVLSVIGQISDLIFSKIKRENKIKDFSNYIPGHGGILDRLDSLMLVVIAYILLFQYI